MTYTVTDPLYNVPTVAVQTSYNWYILGQDQQLWDWLEDECSIWANIIKTAGLM